MKLILALLLAVSFNADARCFNGEWDIYCGPDYRGDGDSPIIIDQFGDYRGNLNGNKYDPNSISNPYGRYGSKYSPDSLNNPYAYPRLNTYGF